MPTTSAKTSYSARVDLWLTCSDRRISLAQTASNYVIAAENITLAPGDAVLFLSIDGELQQRHIRLPQGISPDRKRTPYTTLDVA